MKRFLLLIGTLIFTQIVSAYTISDYKSRMLEGGETKSIIELYLMGFGQGLSWANSHNEVNNKKPIFCPPPKLTITGGVILSVVNNGLKNTKMKDSDPLELFLLTEMERVFPCN